MYPVDDLFAAYARSFEAHREAEMTLPEYLEASRDDAMMYASSTERLLAAIGEPDMVDTAKDARLGRIFMNRTMRVYPAFSEFYGMEETIERIVGFLRHAAQGLEERKQIMYRLGPVGGGKSSLAERLKALMEACNVLAATFNHDSDAPRFSDGQKQSVPVPVHSSEADWRRKRQPILAPTLKLGCTPIRNRP